MRRVVARSLYGLGIAAIAAALSVPGSPDFRLNMIAGAACLAIGAWFMELDDLDE